MWRHWSYNTLMLQLWDWIPVTYTIIPGTATGIECGSLFNLGASHWDCCPFWNSYNGCQFVSHFNSRCYSWPLKTFMSRDYITEGSSPCNVPVDQPQSSGYLLLAVLPLRVTRLASIRFHPFYDTLPYWRMSFLKKEGELSHCLLARNMNSRYLIVGDMGGYLVLIYNRIWNSIV